MKSIAVDNLLQDNQSNEQNFTDDIVIENMHVACAGPTLPNPQ